MRKVSSGEAEFFRDPALAARLRFRFAGPMFPPSIVYKVYCNSKVSYLSGCTHIRGTTTAAEDACDVMGEHKCGRLQFYTLLRGVYTLCPDRYRDIVMTDVLRDAPRAAKDSLAVLVEAAWPYIHDMAGAGFKTSLRAVVFHSAVEM